MHVLYVLTSIVLLLGNCCADCPHNREDLLRWSSAATWGSSGKPKDGQNLNISQKILMDESPPSLHNITIKAGGLLTFSPDVAMELRARNIFVQGNMEIGGEDCTYNQSLTITLTGNHNEHKHEKTPKVILVESGGTLEIHGEPRRSWTKINKTLVPPQNTTDMYFEHTPTTFDGNGIVAYTFQVVDTVVTVKQSGLYFLKTQSQLLASHINNVAYGDVLMMAGQEKIVTKTSDKQDNATYDALEMLVYGSVTRNITLRSVPSDGATWAFVFKKGTAGSYQETTNALGTTSEALYKESEELVYLAESIGDSVVFKQTVNFKVMHYDALHQIVDLMDDVSTWRPGDKIVISSTDYDWKQAEKREIVFCPTCSNFQIRIKEPVNFMHFGKVLHDVIDMRASVALLSRKVVIRGTTEPTCPKFNGNCGAKEVLGKDTFGGHTKAIRGFKDVHIENVEAYNMGQHTDLGRYPFHFHLCLGREAGASVPYIKGCSIHDSFARCVTIHGSHGVLIQDNACYNFMGHGYFMEDGGEVNNTFDGNLAISALKGTGGLEPTDKDRPSGFWLTNPLTYVRNNVAAGGEGTGIWVIYPVQPLPPSRQFNIFAPYEARKTNMLEFTNNIAHSNAFFGIHIGGRIEENRQTHCCNIWQPLQNPKDNKSDPINVYLKYLTGEEVIHEEWISNHSGYSFNGKRYGFRMTDSRQGKDNLSKMDLIGSDETFMDEMLVYHSMCAYFSVASMLNQKEVKFKKCSADSTNGIMVSNEKLLSHAGTLSQSVIIGNSENKGEPAPGYDRSIAETDKPHSGAVIWRGVVRYFDLWFDGFKSDYGFDNAAIAKKRGDRYFFSVVNSFKNAQFAFDDPEDGNIFISGNKTDPGWEDQRDGEIGAGFTWFQDTPSGTVKWYVVKPDPFSAAGADCKLRKNWRMAMCKTKYGTWRVTHPGIEAFFQKKSFGIFVRDKYPGANLTFDLEKSAGPSVVLDSSETYTFHVTGRMPSWISFSAEGIEKNETLRIGVCIPLGAKWELKSKFPYPLNNFDKFIKVDSLAELDKWEPEIDGKKYFYNSTTGMVYYKFLGVKNRAPDDRHECADNRCPTVQVILSGDLSGSADCRQKLYGSRLSHLPPALPEITETFKANGSSSPPKGYGHGYQRPFPSRKSVNGRYSPWTSWSECSKTCGGGTQYKTRECNNPMPEHGGGGCVNTWIKSKSCSTQNC